MMRALTFHVDGYRHVYNTYDDFLSDCPMLVVNGYLDVESCVVKIDTLYVKLEQTWLCSFYYKNSCTLSDKLSPFKISFCKNQRVVTFDVGKHDFEIWYFKKYFKKKIKKC